jgi:hypothetical protein
VPAKKQGLDGAARPAPLREPARAIVCAYIRSPTTAAESGSVLLTGDLSGVMNDLAWMAPARALPARPCTADLLLTDGDYYLIGLSYSGSTEWVAAPSNHCAGSSNGVFTSTANLSGRASAWYEAHHWTATPGSNDACNPSGFGRLGQQGRMVPDHPVSVSVCEVSAADGGKATQRTETTGVGSLASAFGALRASAWHYQCRPDGQPLTDYNFLFGYPEGRPVIVSIVGDRPKRLEIKRIDSPQHDPGRSLPAHQKTGNAPAGRARAAGAHHRPDAPRQTALTMGTGDGRGISHELTALPRSPERLDQLGHQLVRETNGHRNPHILGCCDDRDNPRIPLRNDEDHVCTRSAQPPRVPVDQ